MSIYEYDAKKQRKFDHEEGCEEGREIHLVEQVCKKLQKEMPISQIAAEVEEDEARVQQIADIANKYAPDYEIEKIVNEMIVTCVLYRRGKSD